MGIQKNAIKIYDESIEISTVDILSSSNDDPTAGVTVDSVIISIDISTIDRSDNSEKLGFLQDIIDNPLFLHNAFKNEELLSNYVSFSLEIVATDSYGKIYLLALNLYYYIFIHN